MSVKSLKKGFGFGLTSGVITTLGLIIGLGFSTNSKVAVITGILTIAFADSFSDALGIHISEEAEGDSSTKDIWSSTIYTLVFKILFTMTFLVPVLIFPLQIAIGVCCFWGFLLLGIFSFVIGREEHENPLKVVLEHFMVALFVVIITFILGEIISTMI